MIFSPESHIPPAGGIAGAEPGTHLIITDRFGVRVGRIFEGPMDLLVFLIRKNEVDIRDIPISLITEQYLDAVRSLDIAGDSTGDLTDANAAGEFLLMASTLTQIKSRMLLPVHGNGDGEEEDPRLEIARPLAEYMQLKDAARTLVKRDLLGWDVFPRIPDAARPHFGKEDQPLKVDLYELTEAFRDLLARMNPEQRMKLRPERFSVRDRISHILAVLEERGSALFHELFSPSADLEEMITTFLAVLEMARLHLIGLMQQRRFGWIRVEYL